MTSTATPMAWKPSAVSFAASLSAEAPFRSASTTDAPASHSARPYTTPMLPAPPVMTATFPLKSKNSLGFIVLLLARWQLSSMSVPCPVCAPRWSVCGPAMAVVMTRPLLLERGTNRRLMTDLLETASPRTTETAPPARAIPLGEARTDASVAAGAGRPEPRSSRSHCYSKSAFASRRASRSTVCAEQRRRYAGPRDEGREIRTR